MKYNIDTAYKIIDILGKNKIEEVYDIVNSVPVSFSLLKRIVVYDEIKKDVYEGMAVNDIVKTHKVSRMTVYRLIKENQ